MRFSLSTHLLLATTSASISLRQSKFTALSLVPNLSLSFGSGSAQRTNMSSTTVLNESSSGVGLGDVSSKPQRNDLSLNVPWKEAIDRSIARSRKIRGSNFVQLATVSEENEPRVRSVVFRGFASREGDLSTTMKLITDSRSKKVRDIQCQSDNMAELLWWFGKSSEQYRFRCRAELIGDDSTDEKLKQLRKEQWGNLSDKAREQFYWLEPGISYENQCEVPEGGRNEEGKVLVPPPTFILVLLYPLEIDYLRLTDNYRQVDKYDQERGSWNLKRVNP